MTKKTDTKAEATTSVVVAKKRLIGEPGVIAIGGVILEPIAQVDKVNVPLDHNGVLLVDYDFTQIGDKSAKLSIYSYSVGSPDGKNAVDLFVVADELSSLDIEIPGHLHFQNKSFTVITLVNSQSKNDYFLGGVVLVGVESEDNSYQDSIIELRRHYFGDPSKGAKTNPQARRVKVQDVDAEKVRFRGQSLPAGSYYDSSLTENTFIRGELDDDSRRVNIWKSALRWCSFREGAIDIRNAEVTHSTFHFTGDVKLDSVTVKEEYFNNLPGIYLASKFDLTSIDVAGQSPAQMIRVDADNVLITLPVAKERHLAGEQNRALIKMPFRNPNSRRSLRLKAMEMFFGDNMPSEMEESVLDYLADTVLSRCSMINLMDSAKRLLASNLLGAGRAKTIRPVPGLPSFLGPRVTEIYGNSTELANEYDKTIYIDKVGKF